MKFKIGDKVRFIGDYNEHLNDIGHSKLTLKDLIKKFNNILTVSNPGGYVEVKEDEFWCFKEDELELIQDKQFSKSDLKDGDIVTYRNGEKRYVDAINKKIVYIDNHHCLSFTFDNFNEDLTDKACDGEYDIIKVERPTGYETIFERKEEILDETEKRYLRDVIRPFRKDVKNIGKNNFYKGDYIRINLKDEAIDLPFFKQGTMYKGMELNREYTLKELGL